MSLQSTPNQYGPPGPGIFGVPFAGRWAEYGRLQAAAAFFGLLLAAPIAFAMPASLGDGEQLAATAAAIAPFVLISLNVVLAAEAFKGTVLWLFERSSRARVRVYPSIYGATLDVRRLDYAAPWGATTIDFRGRWALPWWRHSLELGFRTPSSALLYASGRGSWFCDARSRSLRAPIREWLTTVGKACGQWLHVAVADGEVRVGIHDPGSMKICWATLDREVPRLAEMLLASNDAPSGYRDGVGDAASMDAVRARVARTRVLDGGERPEAWWATLGRERRWFRQDVASLGRDREPVDGEGL